MPDDASLGRRMLAAVMFTDVVDFSRRVGEDERRGLRLTGRDLDLIAELVRMFDGRVLKRTGDGVLAVFASGVQSVACAQEIQKQLAEQAQALPAEEVLEHRIGIHLGDVYVIGNEVMGDGVNVAARLQAEAPPGGIAITQALFEVAKTRLSFRTVHMGARRLKNIAEAVQVYQVLPGGKASRRARRLAAVFRRPGVKLVAGALGLLVVVLLAVLLALNLADRRARDGRVADPAAVALAEYPKVKAGYLKTRDYAGLAAWIEEQGLERPDSALHDDFMKYRRLSDLFDWLEEQLVAFTPETPLEFESPAVGKMRLWSGEEGLRLQVGAGEAQSVDLRAEAKASFVLNVMRAVALDRWGEGRPARGSDNAHLLEGLILFARENDLETQGLLAGLVRRQGTASKEDLDARDEDLFIRFDLNKDGRLSRGELPQLIRNRMMLADSNNDGMLTVEELRASRKRMGIRRGQPRE